MAFRWKRLLLVTLIVGGLALIFTQVVGEQNRAIVIIGFFIIEGLFMYKELNVLEVTQVGNFNYLRGVKKEYEQALKQNYSNKIQDVILTGLGRYPSRQLGYRGHFEHGNHLIIQTRTDGLIQVPFHTFKTKEVEKLNKDGQTEIVDGKKVMIKEITDKKDKELVYMHDGIIYIEGTSIYGGHRSGFNPVVFPNMSVEDFNYGDNINAVKVFEDVKGVQGGQVRGGIEHTIGSNMFGILQQMLGWAKGKK